MKVKELHKTVNVAWSPQSQYPILMAAGTAAQQLDASFSTNASLDLYLLNLKQPGYEMQLSNSVMSDQRSVIFVILVQINSYFFIHKHS
jgi:protein transport protein SEC31